jgi:hypothetical protein
VLSFSLAAALCLVLALAWHCGLSLADARAVQQAALRGRAYRLGQGWLDRARLEAERWPAVLGLEAASVLAVARLVPDHRAAAVTALSCIAALIVVLWDRRLRGGRYTSVCLATLATALVLERGLPLVGINAAIAGLFASFCASQLYLVAGVRKLRSAQFMNGRVLLDNFAYNSYQAATGSRDFLPVPGLPALAVLIHGTVSLRACRAAATLTAVVELALGLGALGLFPAPFVISLAVPAHLAFTMISPRRIVAFSAAAIGQLLLAMTHPLLTPWW